VRRQRRQWTWYACDADEYVCIADRRHGAQPSGTAAHALAPHDQAQRSAVPSLQRVNRRGSAFIARGSDHLWGDSHRLGSSPHPLLQAALKHTGMIVVQASDAESTGGVSSAFGCDVASAPNLLRIRRAARVRWSRERGRDSIVT